MSILEKITPILKVVQGAQSITEIERRYSAQEKIGVFMCRRGEMEVELSGRVYRLTRGEAFFFTPSMSVRLIYKNHLSDSIMAEADMQQVLPMINKVISAEEIMKFRDEPFFSLAQQQFDYLEKIALWYARRIEEVNTAGQVSPMQVYIQERMLNSMAEMLIYEFFNMYYASQPAQAQPQTKKDVVYQRFMIDLLKYYRQERDVTFYAALQQMAPRYFSCVIKEKSGKSALHWIVQMVITESKQLLKNSDMSIKEIAEHMNFSTQSFFGKYFKQYVGVSPKDFRMRKTD